MTQTKQKENPYVGYEAEIIEIKDLSHDTRYFKTSFVDPKFPGNFDYRPGQFAIFSIYGVGEAPFSISSTPTRPRFLEFGIRKVGTFTNALFKLKEGDKVTIRGPYGNGFDLVSMENKDIIVVAGGLGAVPLRSVLLYIEDMRHKYNNVYFLNGARTPADMLFREDFIAMHKRDIIETYLTVDQDPTGEWPYDIGVVTTLFKKIEDLISKEENFEEEIRALIRKYEEGEREVRELIREISNSCLEGFKETLSRIGVEIDSWDWESEFIWNGSVAKVIEKLKETPYVFWREGVLEFDAEKTAKEFNLKGKLGLEESYEIPSLTLVRADGTTLYTTRDIAYSIWKLSRADKVINVVGMEQRLAQLQMKLALYALGMGDLAQNLIHFAYNLVRLPGYRMSSRRGRYITLDEVIDEAINRAYKEVSKRSPHLPGEEKRKISEVVGIGAIRFFLVSVDPAKPVTFTWDKVLDFERNSAPYIQYTHSRATSILRKADESPSQPNLSLLSSNVERRIVWTLSKFPEAVIEGSENLKPNLIADYILNLADLFNSFYNSTPVLHAENIELRNARLALVESVRIVLRNGLNLLGIEAPERM